MDKRDIMKRKSTRDQLRRSNIRSQSRKDIQKHKERWNKDINQDQQVYISGNYYKQDRMAYEEQLQEEIRVIDWPRSQR